MCVSELGNARVLDERHKVLQSDIAGKRQPRNYNSKQLHYLRATPILSTMLKDCWNSKATDAY